MSSVIGEREDTTNKRGPFSAVLSSSLHGNFVLVPTLYPEEDREEDGYFSVWFTVCKQIRPIKVAAVAKHNRNDLVLYLLSELVRPFKIKSSSHIVLTASAD